MADTNNDSAAIATTGEAGPSAAPAPVPELKKAWADEVDEDEEEAAESSEEKSKEIEEKLNIENLKIDEKKKADNLNDPDESNITATNANQYIIGRIRESFSLLPNSLYVLLPTVCELEHRVIDALKKDFSFPIYTTGPNIPYFNHEDIFSKGDTEYFQWVDNQPVSETPYTSAKRFEDLNLSPELIKGLYVEMGFEKPSKIQAITLPMIVNPPYKNLIAQAHNGSGKTTCFVLGMLSRVDPNLKVPQACCICPTRELAVQNLEVLQKMGKYTGITSECAVRMDSSNTIPMSRRPPVTAQVVIGTPGTLLGLITKKKLSLNYLRILVFDEADHMLAEDGFRDDSLRIMKSIEKSNVNCQVLLFSATFDENVKKFVTRVIKDYNQLFVKKEELSLQSVKQFKVFCPDELAKVHVIKDRIMERVVGQTIMFVHSKNSAKMLHQALQDYGYDVTTIHGALDIDFREKIVKEFKDGLTQVLIATDILSRGFDDQKVNVVVNYDIPVKYTNRSEPDYEVYLHRIGRAGRFGTKGAVFNLLCDDRDKAFMEKIEKYFNSTVTEISSWTSEEEFDAAFKSAGLLH